MSRRAPTCHPDRKHCAKGLCYTCYGRQNAKNWRTNNVKRATESVRKWRANNPEFVRKLSLKKYGLTTLEFNLRVRAQGGVCAICRRPSGKVLNVDHDHKTERSRGLLCANCNTAIGLFKENTVAILEAKHYLEFWSLV